MLAMFEDRVDAAKKLCRKLKKISLKNDVVVVGLTKGGLVTAQTIANCLQVKLRALIVKKISSLQNPELALGAVSDAKYVYWNKSLVRDIDDKEKRKLVAKGQKEIEKLRKFLKIETKIDEYENKTVILVDDGVATGASVIAGAKYLRKQKAEQIILAAPVIAFDTLINIKNYFDRIVYLRKERNFYAVGQFYINFEQISDGEVARILETTR